jgi:hypothetical protein
MRKPLDDNSPLAPQKVKKMLQEAAGLESSLGEIWKLLAESCDQKCSGKISSAESA